ncbi:unnamed protein product [Linum tenue]|uniref:BLISTER n=1 Tax=Linum tenue TaxID=586396 RepID=A0AAV0LRG5_9ROSI|nr:unnamed protein product [Linum tenue]
MASVQVLRKQEHLEAGKRRLEEFRKKKAADRAKKAGALAQSQGSDVNIEKKPLEKKPLETEQVRVTASDGVGTSSASGVTFQISSQRNKGDHLTTKVEHSTSKIANASPSALNDFSTIFSDIGQRSAENSDLTRSDALGIEREGVTKYGLTNSICDSSAHASGQGVLPDGILSDQPKNPQVAQGFDSSFSHYKHSGTDAFQQEEYKSSSWDSIVANPGSQTSSLNRGSIFSNSEAKPVDSSQPNTNLNLRGSGNGVEKEMRGTLQTSDSTISDFGRRDFKSLASWLPGVHGDSTQLSEPTSNSGVKDSSNHASLHGGQYETNSRRSRPSFLDSINVARPTLASPFSQTKPYESFMPVTSNSNGTDVQEPSTLTKPFLDTEMGPFSKSKSSSAPDVYEHSWKSSVSSSNGFDVPRSNINDNNIEGTHEFYAPQQNEDFSALEQHIEDLTQEKFSLQRALEASRALAESLASENTSLTDTYNQQVELESVKAEYTNAQLECNAADERAKLLASEVIGLEEKALRLRSNELKLERELEKSHAEIASRKKKISNLERERLDLHSTIDALQEEKKLLQSKLRKASTGGKSIDAGKITAVKRDMSTSTEDLEVFPDTSDHETSDAALTGSNVPSSSVSPEIGQPDNGISPASIPADQLRMIQNINEIMSELAFEKEELMKALASESSQCSKLKDLNKDLSRKLETQTQRLELLAAQSMATENIATRLPESRSMQENPAYADEGDEVVERVLGWIMKLFPGGPTKRRTSKLL